jgi:hypothetical protein
MRTCNASLTTWSRDRWEVSGDAHKESRKKIPVVMFPTCFCRSKLIRHIVAVNG